MSLWGTKLLHDSPGVDDVLLAAPRFIAVENQVTVSTKKVAVGRRVHRHCGPVLDSPDLQNRC